MEIMSTHYSIHSMKLNNKVQALIKSLCIDCIFLKEW